MAGVTYSVHVQHTPIYRQSINLKPMSIVCENHNTFLIFNAIASINQSVNQTIL